MKTCMSRWRPVLATLVAPLAIVACASGPDYHGHRPPPREQVTCSSSAWERQRCAQDWRDAVLVETLSRKECRRDETWGVDARGLWVDHGCRGRFERIGPGRDDERGDIVDCASEGNGYRRCGLDRRADRVELHRQLSRADCERGESWGWDRHAIWVDKGCRAEFRVEWR